MNKIKLFLFLLVASPLLFAQNNVNQKNYVRCITTEVNAALEQKHPAFKISTQHFENWIRPLIQERKIFKTQDEIITIPVVIHVIHNGDLINSPNKIHGENISYAQAISQINVLNQDFRRLAGSPGAQVSGYGLGVDTKIEFKLATIAPDGTATNGIDRVNLCKEAWTTKEINNILKPQTIWDPTKYFNIWIVKFHETEGEYLGYAQSPVQSGLPGLKGPTLANTDGVVANYIAFGTVAEDDGSFILNEKYNRGRTITHEVGHWLGLIHTWGDGDCSKDDYCDDTPVSESPTYECNFSKKSCNSIDMIENYMDYTDDECMNTFTYDQMVRMQTVLKHSPRRKELKDANVFVESPYTLDAQLKLNCDSGAQILPCNQINGIITEVNLINHSKAEISSAKIEYGIEGRLLQTYEWKGKLSQFQSTTIELPPITNGIQNGNNKVIAKIISINGKIDQFIDNNIDTQYYHFTDQTQKSYKDTAYILEIKPDQKGAEIFWEIRDSNNEVIIKGGPYQNSNSDVIIENINLTADNCYTFIIYDKAGNGLCCGGYYILQTEGKEIVKEGSSYSHEDRTTFNILSAGDIEDDDLKISPNPTDGIIFLRYRFKSDKQDVRVFNEIGQLMFKENLKNNQVDLSGLHPGVYVIQIEDGNQLLYRKIILH
ncbi:MAG: M43 family zinc metalloprotease [Weeksellaceae bacterium]